MPRDCRRIIESKSKVRNSRNKLVVVKVSSSSSTPGISLDVAELKDMVKALLLEKKNQTQAPTPVKAVEESCVTCGGAHSYQNFPTNRCKRLSTTIPTTSSPPKVVERETEVTKDMVPPTNNGSTKDVQPPVVQVETQRPNSEHVSALMPNLKPSIPYPSRRNDERRREKANDQPVADLGARHKSHAIILVKKHSLPELDSYLYALLRKLADRSITKPISIALRFYLKVRKVQFSATLLSELTLRDGNRNPYHSILTKTLEMTPLLHDRRQTELTSLKWLVRSILRKSSVSPIVDAFLALEDDPTSSEVDDSEGDILLLESFLNDDPSPLPTKEIICLKFEKN
ncbi:hypothetical protein Tco_1217222 [Tanacetum coccineum]